MVSEHRLLLSNAEHENYMADDEGERLDALLRH